jgi:hypothetical protein
LVLFLLTFAFMRLPILLTLICALLSGCKTEKKPHPTFYYWKTVYSQNKTEQQYLEKMQSRSLYVRIMDIDLSPDGQQAIPISPITFKESLPQQVNIIPVVYIVNNILNVTDSTALKTLAGKIAVFVQAKVQQAGKKDYQELQIDCDWTKTTKDRYFYFLEQLKKLPQLRNKEITVTLRLHQVKNIESSGIPPVKKAMLMCYNMGNLRKYGSQNSILDQAEMDLYLKDHLKNYPLALDVALPLFKWAVIFRNQQYAGISKRLQPNQLHDKNMFKKLEQPLLYQLLVDLPQAGLKKNDIVRWEHITTKQLLQTADFLSAYLPSTEFNLTFYHLDEQLLNDFKYDDLQKVIHRF